jgi:hypothetical protein
VPKRFGIAEIAELACLLMIYCGKRIQISQVTTNRRKRMMTAQDNKAFHHR